MSQLLMPNELLMPTPPGDIVEVIDREREAFGPFGGAFHRQWLREHAPDEVQRHLRLAAERPNIIGMPEQAFTGGAFVPPFAHTAINTTTTETYLWIPGQFSSIPYGDPVVGKAYFVKYGGIYGTTATPTVQNTMRWHGATTTTVGGTACGTSATVTTPSGVTNVPFFGECVVVIRSLALAASSSTITTGGFTCLQGAVAATVPTTMVMGTNATATVDTYTQTNLGIGLGWTWSANSASNTVTCQMVVFGSYN